MNVNPRDEVKIAIAKASEAMRQKNKAEAFFWASQAARLSPNNEDAWLIMAAVSSPRDSLNYLNQALQINPQSKRAREGITWATRRLNAQSQSSPETVQAELPETRQVKVGRKTAKKPSGNKWINIALFWVGCVVILCTSTVAVSAFASNYWYLSAAKSAPQTTQVVEAPADTPTDTDIPQPSPTLTETPPPTQTEVPTATPTETFTPIPATPTSPPVVEAIPITPPAVTPTALIAGGLDGTSADGYSPEGDEFWIDVNLSSQTLYAYQGSNMVNSFIMSSGTAKHPTVTGQYRIYLKFRADDMQGPGYYLTNVPYVMYFYKGYGIHGTYWHTNFGTPMSHGCINLPTEDAKWLFERTQEGTLVNIHY